MPFINKIINTVTKSDLSLFITLLIISFLVYLQIIFFSLTGCDDKLLINNSKTLVQNSSLTGLITAPYLFQNGMFFRPVVNLSFTIPVMIAGDSIILQYTLNIIFHAINSYLIFILLKKTGASASGSFFLAVLFILHPVCTNAVAWLPGRNDSLLTIFILLAILYYDRYLEKGSYSDLAVNCFFFLLSLFTKETAAAAICIFIIFYFIKKTRKVNELTYSFSAWVMCTGIWFLARSAVIHDEGPLEYLKNIPFLIQALGKEVLPFNLSVLPTISDTTFIFGIISVLLIAAGLYVNKKRNNNLIILGACWFVVFMIPPLLNINPEYNQNLMLESRLYLPLAGIIILFSQISFPEKINAKAIGFFTIILIPAVMCYLTVKYSSFYRDDISFWENAVNNSPSLDLSYSGLALINLQKENYEKAAELYVRAVSLNPSKPGNNRQAGYCYLNLNKSQEAEKYFRAELALNPDDYDSNLLAGIICFKTGKPLDAEKFLQAAFKLNSKDFQPSLYLLKLYHRQKNYKEAYRFAEILKSGGYKIPDEIKKDLNLQ